MSTFQKPSVADLRHAADRLGMNPSMHYLETMRDIVAPLCAAYAALDAFPDEKPAVKYPDRAWRRPAPAENPLGAWYVTTSIKGAPDGKLKGRRVALKDNVCLAGVPMMVGAQFLDGTIPDVDATIATRILDAGGEIAGKAVCEYYCVSGGSHTSSTGPVQNPRRRGRTTGGSSSGSAALVASGEVPMAIGGDQAGSIRIPASYCGIVGLKPTFGLVPYTGIGPLEMTIDCAGPMTASVADNALLLEVIAGADGLDSRQQNVRTDCYTATLGGGVEGLRIGVLKEGFGHPNSEPDVDAKVRAAAERFRALGASVQEVSVPEHLTLGFPVWAAIRGDAACITLLEMNGFGINHDSFYPLSAMQAAMQWREHADEFADTLKIASILSRYTVDRYGGLYYAKAQNLRRRLRAAYDAAFASHDLLLLPPTVMKATPIPPPGAPPQEVTRRSWEATRNTSPFNVTGHPAISIPCGMSEGLPVGLMLVGKHWQEGTIYRASHAFEQSADWRTM
ncbi:MAG: amidase [Alphaproteobacteria bacterium]|nr:amidase [Alphaproteobacteria bacterium]